MKQETPPPTHQTRTYTDWTAVAAEMTAHPGDWYRIGEFSTGIPNHLRKGAYKQFLDPDDPTPADVQMRQKWEVTARKVDGFERSKVTVFMRRLKG